MNHELLWKALLRFKQLENYEKQTDDNFLRMQQDDEHIVELQNDIMTYEFEKIEFGKVLSFIKRSIVVIENIREKWRELGYLFQTLKMITCDQLSMYVALINR